MRLGQTSFIYFVSKIIATIAGFAATIIFARVLGAEILGIYSLALGVTAWVTLPTTVGIGGAINKRLSEGSDVGEYMTAGARSEEHTSELQSHAPISYAVFCLKKKK